MVFHTTNDSTIEALIGAWQSYIAHMGDWRRLVDGITPRQTYCGPIYEVASPLDRPDESFAIADMREVAVSEPHYHTGSEIEIYFILSGTGLTVVGGKELKVMTGDVIVTPPDTTHFTIPHGQLVLIAINTPPFDSNRSIHISETKLEVGYDHEQYKRLLSTTR